MPVNQSHKTGAGGFTLIELILVLFIVVAGMAVIGPSISSGHSSAQLRAAARDMESALRYVRGYALASQREAVFSIDLDENSYSVDSRERVYPIPKEIAITLVTAQTELSGEGKGSIRFYPDGSSTGGRVTLESGELKKIIDVNWLTGGVESSYE
ncbi:MAG: GspH/FimT family pseudopilin [Gammaproteobacteria bacterium]